MGLVKNTQHQPHNPPWRDPDQQHSVHVHTITHQYSSYLKVLPTFLYPSISITSRYLSNWFAGASSDHYFRCVCLSVCLWVSPEHSSVTFDAILMKLGRKLDNHGLVVSFCMRGVPCPLWAEPRPLELFICFSRFFFLQFHFLEAVRNVHKYNI